MALAHYDRPTPRPALAFLVDRGQCVRAVEPGQSGALGADSIGDPTRWGLDAAVPAAFLALLWPQITDRRLLQVAVTAAVVGIALTPVLSPACRSRALPWSRSCSCGGLRDLGGRSDRQRSRLHPQTLGFVVPERMLDKPLVAQLVAMFPIALLSAPLAVVTVADGMAVVIDARVAAVPRRRSP